jgi:hypothetical protein
MASGFQIDGGTKLDWAATRIQNEEQNSTQQFKINDERSLETLLTK